ncbi:MAG TPA: triose-phosphate isomerase [Candidatus Saccharimonadales bacterium]|jgi:triosephosphate isomerase|nr:triose-phosphate isomerase [Candidatus Saccharimonadales bacterium]
MAKKIVIANWKMNLNTSQASLLLHRLQERIRIRREVEIVLAPSMLVLQPLSVQLDRRKFRLAAQNAYFQDSGAFTGEVSFTMLQDLVHYVIIGHSERRIYFNETLEVISKKVAACVRNGISPILCVGETKQERKLGETKQVLHDQIYTALSELTSSEVANLIIAYEPVWAISTFGGEVATPAQINRVMEFIRMEVEELYGPKAAKKLKIIYGGSVDDKTAGGYLQMEQCSGVLVGSASLNYIKFAGIVDEAYRQSLSQPE